MVGVGCLIKKNNIYYIYIYWRPKVTRKFAALETEQYFEKFVIFMILTHMPMIVQELPLYFCTRKVWRIA